MHKNTHELPILQLPCEPPPILPDIREQFEVYLTKPQNLPLHNQKNDFELLKRKIDLNSLYHIELSPVTTTLTVRISTENIDCLVHESERIVAYS